MFTGMEYVCPCKYGFADTLGRCVEVCPSPMILQDIQTRSCRCPNNLVKVRPDCSSIDCCGCPWGKTAHPDDTLTNKRCVDDCPIFQLRDVGFKRDRKYVGIKYQCPCKPEYKEVDG
jgi:hypothetical protein